MKSTITEHNIDDCITDMLNIYDIIFEKDRFKKECTQFRQAIKSMREEIKHFEVKLEKWRRRS